jgi:endonuclease III related protein
VKRQLFQIYRLLLEAYGPQYWWPADTPFEVMVGAILTQNTSWRNVEKSVNRLKEEGVLHPEGMHRLKTPDLASIIRSSGYFRIKADRLKEFIHFLYGEFDGDLMKMKRVPWKALRQKLLGVKGIGPETADSILLYGLEKPVFVVDAYTTRVLSNHGMVSPKTSYEEVQDLFMKNLPSDTMLFNEYHALLVHLGKWVCKKRPRCDICPLKDVKRKG